MYLNIKFAMPYLVMLFYFICLCTVNASVHVPKIQPEELFPEKVPLKFFDRFKVRNVDVNSNDQFGKNPVYPPLHVGSFNIQTLGKKKFENYDVMRIVEKIVHRYDLILIMELITTEERFMEKLLRDINKFAPTGVVYNMTLSESHPYTHEHCSFIYRTDKLRVVEAESYDHPNKLFFRKPYIVIFDSPTLRDMKRFGVIGLHVKPNKALEEMNGLAQLYDLAKVKYKTEDILLMGDFNADCNYIKEQQWVNVTLWTRPEFVWPIGTHVDTTTNHKSCALDRFVAAGKNMTKGIMMSTAQVFDFQETFELTVEEVRAISDHWPIELKIRGGMSTLAEKYLESNICFTIQDSRSRNVNKELLCNGAKLARFNVSQTSDGFLLSNESSSEGGILIALKELRNILPQVVTHEQFHGILYKIQHGSLNDGSAVADNERPKFKITVLQNKNYSQIITCKTTTVN